MPFLRKEFLKAAYRPNHLDCRIDSIPFLGFTFVLLCAFMTSEPMITHGVSFDLFARVCSHQDLDRQIANRVHHATLNGAEKKSISWSSQR